MKSNMMLHKINIKQAGRLNWAEKHLDKSGIRPDHFDQSAYLQDPIHSELEQAPLLCMNWPLKDVSYAYLQAVISPRKPRMNRGIWTIILRVETLENHKLSYMRRTCTNILRYRQRDFKIRGIGHGVS